MNRLKATLAIALVSLLSLTACGEEAKNAAEGTKDAAKTATDGAMKAGGDAVKAGGDAVKAGGDAVKARADGAVKAGEAAKDTVAGVADKATGAMSGAMSLVNLKDSIPDLKNSATAAITAAKAGDFKTAQAEVSKLQDSWKNVSEIVKKHSSGDFEKITTTLKTVQTELTAPSPDKGKIVADLQSLATQVQGLVALK